MKSDQEIWEGEWNFGFPHGKMKYRNSDGVFYFGDFKYGMKNGKGIYLCEDDTIYSGEYRDGIHNGKGIYFHSNGETYLGQFVKGLPNGKGMYFLSDGRIYLGEFREGKRNGKGMEFYPNGNIYSGFFKNDKECGGGRMYYPNGHIQDNPTILDLSNSVSDIIIKKDVSDDIKIIFGRENIIIKLVSDFHVSNSEIFYILTKKLEENMNNSINLRNIFNNINLEEIIFTLLSDINKLGKSSILTSLISKRSSNVYFSPHTILLYGYYLEMGRSGIIIIDSLFPLLYYFLFVLLF
jgi:hypothetical protein